MSRLAHDAVIVVGQVVCEHCSLPRESRLSGLVWPVACTGCYSTRMDESKPQQPRFGRLPHCTSDA